MTKKNKFIINDICEIAVMVALSLVLDKLKISLGATGGSINLSMVPLIFLSIRKKFWKSFLASSIIFGFLSCLFDGYGLQYLPFDYVLAFSGYAFVGLFYRNCFKNKSEVIRLILALIISLPIIFVIRVGGHTLSSIIFYGYSLKASLIYNIPYVGISLIVSFVVLFALIKPILYLNKKFIVK